MCLEQDVARSREAVAIPVKGLAPDRLAHLAESFHTYVADSVINNEAIASTSGSSAVGSEQSDDEDWGCECGDQSGNAVCTVADGDACDCVGQFGNFYSSGNGDQLLRLDALPERLPLVECGPDCSCGDRCTNRVTQRGVRLPLTVRPAKSGVGLGIYYTPLDHAPLPKGSFICLYAGEYLTTEQARQRWDSESHAEGEGNYILSLRHPGGVIHIDPRYVGNVGRFLNHSCEPNCVIQLVSWGGGGGWVRAAIFAKRDILPEEELTFDYGNASGASRRRPGATEGGGGHGRTKCLCGSSSCRGWMPYDETL